MSEFDVVDAVISAAERRGEDGRGRDGLVGYYRWMIRKRPRQFIVMFDRAWREAKVPMQLAKTADIRTLADLREHYCKQMPEELAIAVADEDWAAWARERVSKVKPREAAQQQDQNRSGVQAILRAMQQIGEDGCGRGGIEGCLYWLLIKCPGPYFRLLERAEELDMGRREQERREAQPETLEELEEARRRLGIPKSKVLEQFYGPMYPQHLPARIPRAELGPPSLRIERASGKSRR
jgi:hypothetical protein